MSRGYDSHRIGSYRELYGMNENEPPYRLTLDDAVDVWLRHWEGQYQHSIAAAYGVNPGRVNEVLKGHRHPESRTLAEMKRRAA